MSHGMFHVCLMCHQGLSSFLSWSNIVLDKSRLEVERIKKFLWHARFDKPSYYSSIFDAVCSTLVTLWRRTLCVFLGGCVGYFYYNCILKHICWNWKGRKLLAFVGGEGHSKTSENTFTSYLIVLLTTELSMHTFLEDYTFSWIFFFIMLVITTGCVSIALCHTSYVS